MTRTHRQTQSGHGIPQFQGGLLAFLLAAFSFGCSDSAKQEALEREVKKLETDLRQLKSQLDLERETNKSTLTDLTNRLAETERQASELKETSATYFEGKDNRLQYVEEALDQLSKSVSYTIIRPGMETSQPLQNAFGTFLVRIQDFTVSAPGEGYVLKMKVGNTTGMVVHEFVLAGDFGPPRPVPDSGEDPEVFREKLNLWFASRIPFEETYSKTLQPGQWTSVDLPMKASSMNDLEYTQLAMDVRRAGLGDPESEKYLSLIDINETGFRPVRSAFGTFLLAVKSAEPTDSGLLKLTMNIGNPLGLSIAQSRFLGNVGPARPVKKDSENPDEFAQRIEEWQNDIKPFEIKVYDSIGPVRWSEVSLILPVRDRESAEYIELGIEPLNVSLPQPGTNANSTPPRARPAN